MKIGDRDTFCPHWECPSCGGELDSMSDNILQCATEGIDYHKVDGIWHLLAPGRAEVYEDFRRDYLHIRHAEGRGSPEAGYYEALPYIRETETEISSELRWQWNIRARSFEALFDYLGPEENSLRILDLGAGNGWLSHRLSLDGHRPVALDLLVDERDGLGAHSRYSTHFIPVRAEFDRVPFRAGQFDYLIFNASFHYATDFGATLHAVLPLLRAKGQLVIMDTPLYSDPESGRSMVKEKTDSFMTSYGRPSNSLAMEEFLTFERLDLLAREFELDWYLIRPDYGLRWALRPWKAWLTGKREPAEFLLIIGRPRAGS